MFINIILLPLLSAIICGLMGRSIGYQGAKFLSTSVIGFTFLLSIIAFYRVGLNQNPFYIKLGS